ncbi:hypothetical protein CEE37_02665 [candidate division LCP-89 bacterium B3_LCP]|uniref:Cell division protein FtsL n=1 Tax=candidate division LCP-89 bacterium B3_LCP TaxID=2012998 RepID=A0A532V2X3_UNCL8|nr:MAG: hypothetical protein CEE37_02665 [candidate division LCP-89 bacterium B3_LCP]
MPKSKTTKSVNSRRGTANSRQKRARSQAIRPPGPYRPKRKPRPSKDFRLRLYWFAIALIVLAFCLGEVWKSHQVNRLCARLDKLRSQQAKLEEEYLNLQLKADEVFSYHHVEPLVKERLGMIPSKKSPIVITPLDDEFLAYRQKRVKL